MADDYQGGSNSWLAADEVGRVKYPRVKIATGADGTAADVSAQNPLPVAAGPGGPSGATPVSGTATANGQTPAFSPAIGRAVNVRLAGTFGGATVQVEVSFDSGATWSPITVGGQAYGAFTAPVAEPVAEASDSTTRYRLNITSATGSTLINYYLGH